MQDPLVQVSLLNILEGGIGGLIAGILILGVQWLVKFINQPRRDGNEVIIKGKRFTEEKNFKIQTYYSLLEFNICWRHSIHRNIIFGWSIGSNVLPIIVRENQSKFVCLFYQENSPSYTPPKYYKLNIEEIKRLYQLAKDNTSELDFSKFLLQPTEYNIIINWSNEERLSVEEVLYVYLKHRNKLN